MTSLNIWLKPVFVIIIIIIGFLGKVVRAGHLLFWISFSFRGQREPALVHFFCTLRLTVNTDNNTIKVLAGFLSYLFLLQSLSGGFLIPPCSHLVLLFCFSQQTIRVYTFLLLLLMALLLSRYPSCVEFSIRQRGRIEITSNRKRNIYIPIGVRRRKRKEEEEDQRLRHTGYVDSVRLQRPKGAEETKSLQST